MKTFKYTFLPRAIYRYGYFPIMALLLLYLFISAIAFAESWFYVISFFVHLLLIVVATRFYFKVYKKFPFHIETDNKTLYCSDYFLSRKTVEIDIKKIKTVEGGIFSNTLTRPVYLSDGENMIGVSPHIKKYNELLTIILSNIDKKLYDELLARIQEYGEKRKSKRKK